MTVSRVSMTLSEPVAKRTETVGACKAMLDSASGRGRERVLQSTRGVKRIGGADDVEGGVATRGRWMVVVDLTAMRTESRGFAPMIEWN
jgi:hypothetical protein